MQAHVNHFNGCKSMGKVHGHRYPMRDTNTAHFIRRPLTGCDIKNSDGWSCSTAIKRATDGIGMVICQDYPAPLGMNLAAYSKSIAHKWGASSPPSDVKQQRMRRHKVKSSSRCKSWETVRDAISAGYALCTCGGEG